MSLLEGGSSSVDIFTFFGELEKNSLKSEQLHCYGLADEACHLDTIAFSRQVQSDHRQGNGLEGSMGSELVIFE